MSKGDSKFEIRALSLQPVALRELHKSNSSLFFFFWIMFYLRDVNVGLSFRSFFALRNFFEGSLGLLFAHCREI